MSQNQSLNESPNPRCQKVIALTPILQMQIARDSRQMVACKKNDRGRIRLPVWDACRLGGKAEGSRSMDCDWKYICDEAMCKIIHRYIGMLNSE